MNHPEKDTGSSGLRLVSWEATRRCNLSCKHCRATSENHPYDNEIGTTASLQLLDQIRETGTPIVILTGGEVLLRKDIFEIGAHGTDIGLRMVMATNGTLITEEITQKMKDSGIQRVSVSLDGSTSESHDVFRGAHGSFASALQGIDLVKRAGIEFQINTTITKDNLDQIPQILNLAEKLGAAALHIFLLVPTGRGKYIIDSGIEAKEYEKILNWFYDQKKKTRLQLKATCAPHYFRILRQRDKNVTFETHGLDAVTKGCLAGTGFCFISHVGKVQTCGFLDIECGDITQQTFKQVWEGSGIFKVLRDVDTLEGKCGVCGFRRVCGGCRARAYESTGNYLAEEPLCSYVPPILKK